MVAHGGECRLLQSVVLVLEQAHRPFCVAHLQATRVRVRVRVRICICLCFCCCICICICIAGHL